MDHTDVVARIKSELEAKGVSLDGQQGAGEITKRVAWALRSERAGLRRKPGGSGFDWQGQHFAADIISFLTPDGAVNVDILGDAGGDNRPAWSPYPPDPNVDQYHVEAIDPGDAAPADVPGPIPLAPILTVQIENLKQTVINESIATRGQIALLAAEVKQARDDVNQAVKQLIAAGALKVG